MSVPVSLSMTGDQHGRIKRFLFPGDEREAVVIALCGRRNGDRRHRLTVRSVHEVPYDFCSKRTATQVTWSPDFLVPLLESASAERLSIIKIHSHPTCHAAFSETDDIGDARLLPLIRAWV